jgi:hypothetical protein
MLFKYLPGMNLFRDPTKFYILVALSYSILIPFSLHQINSYLSSKFKVQSSKLQLKVKNYLPDLFLLLITCYLLLLIKPAWTGQLGGTFRTKEVPKEYAKLKDFIHSQEDFSRTLWIPTQQRFGFSDYNHPAVSAESFFNSNDPFVIINHLNSERTEEKLRDFSVKYIVVPYDTEKELFLTERKYDKEKKQRIEEGLGKISWLEKKYLFPNIAIFEIKNPKDHFWLEGQKGKVSYKMANPTKYQVDGETVTLESYLIFSERFDSFWTLRLDSKIIPSRQKEDLMNSFNVPLSGRWKGTVEYLPQKYVNLSLIVSGFAILMTMIALAYSHVKKI